LELSTHRDVVPVLVGMPLSVKKESASPVKVTPFVPDGERLTWPLAVKVLPVLTVRLLLTWVKPEVLPIAIVPVALLPKLMEVVALVLNKLAVAWDVVILPPLTARLPLVVISPVWPTVNLVTPAAEAVMMSSFSA